MSSVLACSVYDESLRQGSALAPAGGDSAAAGSAAGGGAGLMASGGSDATGGDPVDAGAPGNGGGPANGGRAGNASGGRAGAPSGGSGGVAASGGTSANGGSSAGGGSAGTGGSVGSAGSSPELALSKPTTASTQQPANPSSSANDGQAATRFSATSSMLPQWWRVDLGAAHALTQVSVQFEFADRKYTYAVETSADDATYTTQANVVDGIGATQVVPIPNQASARYVRITCTSTVPGVDPTSGASRPTWLSLWEVSVQGN